MTATFCTVCDNLFASDEQKCPVCGWPSNSTPVMFGIEQVREIIECVKGFDRKQHISALDLSASVIKGLEEKIEQLRSTR